MNSPSASTAPPSTDSPSRRLLPVVIPRPPLSSRRRGLGPQPRRGGPRPGGTSLQKAEILEDARDPGLLLLEEGRELVGRLVHVDPAALLDDRLPLGAPRHLRQRRVERLLVVGPD